MFHIGGLRDNPCSLAVMSSIAHMNGNVIFLGKFHGPCLKDTSAEARQLQHLVIADAVDLAGVFHNSRVGRVNAVHVGEVLADIRVQDSANGDEGGVGAAASQCGVVALGRHALEAGNNDDLAFFELLENTLLVDRLNASLGKGGIGQQAYLSAGETDGAVSLGVDRHGHEGDGDLFTSDQ